MTLPPFLHVRPVTVEDALSLLSDDNVAYCGGTELLLAMRTGLRQPAVLVDLKRIDELGGVHVDGRHLVVGSTVTHHDLAMHPLVLGQVPMLAAVEASVGNARVRAQGSIGGNLCFAEPKSDVATALVALGAEVTLTGPEGRRSVTVEDFVAGAYFADLTPQELLIDIRIPLPGRGTEAVYVKHQTMERPTVGVAVLDDPETGACRVVVGAVGDRPQAFEFPTADAVDPDEIEAAVDPTPDLSGSERYKRHVTGVYVRRALANLRAERAR